MCYLFHFSSFLGENTSLFFNIKANLPDTIPYFICSNSCAEHLPSNVYITWVKNFGHIYIYHIYDYDRKNKIHALNFIYRFRCHYPLIAYLTCDDKKVFPTFLVTKFLMEVCKWIRKNIPTCSNSALEHKNFLSCSHAKIKKLF